MSRTSAVAVIAALVSVALMSTLAMGERQMVGHVAVAFRNCSIVGSEFNLTVDGDADSHRLLRFLRVPYAEAPVGPRRFAAPQPFDFNRTDCVVNATIDEPDGSLEQQLLRVSIRTPDLAGSRPVLVLLLGGSTDFGGGVGHEDGDLLAAGVNSASGGIVLASVSSRTGVLGNVPAGLNAGLLDQRLAMSFLAEAVAGFGGDASKVALAGHGPEAASAVGLHAVGAVGEMGEASLSFSRIAMLSGSVAGPLAWSASVEAAAALDLRLAAKLHCAISEESRQLPLGCLRNATLESLLKAESELLRSDDGGASRFAPTFNASSLPDARSRWRSFNGSLLIGAGVGAGGALAESALRRQTNGSDWTVVSQSDFYAILDREFGQFPRLHAAANGTSVSGRRFLQLALSDWPHATFGGSAQPTLSRALFDFRVACPTWLVASDVAGGGGSGSVFVYQFDVAKDPADSTGAKAAMDAAYLLGEPLLRPSYPTEHRNLSKLMAQHLTSFIASGAAASGWSASSSEGAEFMHFSADAASNMTAGGFAFEPGRCPLWTAEMPFANGLVDDASPSPTPPTPAPLPMWSASSARPLQLQPAAPQPSANTVLRNHTVGVLQYGDCRGQTVRTPAGKVLTEFLGLPYAKPPIGERRFKPPESPDPLTQPDVYIAISPKPACLQPGPDLSARGDTAEDCLYLNLWTNATADSPADNLPVLVFLHGGFFQAGDASDQRWRGSHVLDREAAVVVSVAYRLGALGFLRLPGIAANLGLLDQDLALQWVSRNVRFFGGDSSKLTLIGVEAGAASVGIRLVSGQRLFSRAVLLTGSPDLPYLVGSGSAQQLEALHSNFTANVLNCSLTLECLQKLSAADIVSAAAVFQRDVAQLPAPFVAFAPVVNLTSALPSALPPLLLGAVEDPGRALLPQLLGGQAELNLTRPELLTYLNGSLRHFPRYSEALTQRGLEAAARRFAIFPTGGSGAFGRTGSGDSEARLLAKALGDRHFSCPTWKFMAATAAAGGGQPVYGFQLADATLFEDAVYAMGSPAGQLSDFLVRTLVKFTETGRADWQPYSASSQRVLLLRHSGGAGNATWPLRYVEDAYRGQDCAFWDQTLPCVDSPDCISGRIQPTPPTPPTTTVSPTTPPTMITDLETSTWTQVTTESLQTDFTGSGGPDFTSSTAGTDATSVSTSPTFPSETPPLSTAGPDVGGGLGTVAIVLIAVFSVVGVGLLAAGGFLIYKFCFRVSGGHLDFAMQSQPTQRPQSAASPAGAAVLRNQQPADGLPAVPAGDGRINSGFAA